MDCFVGRWLSNEDYIYISLPTAMVQRDAVRLTLDTMCFRREGFHGLLSLSELAVSVRTHVSLVSVGSIEFVNKKGRAGKALNAKLVSSCSQ